MQEQAKEIETLKFQPTLPHRERPKPPGWGPAAN